MPTIEYYMNDHNSSDWKIASEKGLDFLVSDVYFRKHKD